ncbi:MAG: NAD(P)H-hydrate dehydratase [Luteimonas sp.]
MSQPRALYDIDALRAIETGVVLASNDDFALMARAGLAAWHSVLTHWPQAQRIVVVCGPGNNGGDGCVMARHALQAGRDVRVLRLAAHASRGAQALRAEADYRAAGGRIEIIGAHENAERAVAQAELIVDALFGIGLSRAPDEATDALIDAINASNAPVLALDVPSGVDADRGAAPGAAVRATRTLQLIAAHPGLCTGDALEHAGEREVATLDLPTPAFDGTRPIATLYAGDGIAGFLAPRRRNAHKGDAGRVLCIGGDRGHGGAIALCAEAALRSGAGLVDVATRPAHVAMLLARRAELMAHAVDDGDGIAALLDLASVIAIGPGLGLSPWGRGLWTAALAAGKPLIVDADALNLLAADPSPLHPHTILTPHPGEAARLLDTTSVKVQGDRFAAVHALRDRHGCVVVLKGAGTLVAAPGEVTRVIDAGNPGMAVGGMGDVLTGVIAALRAQTLSAFDAATCGALLHAVAGDVAARDGGERGLLPSDLFPHLRRLANP